MKLSVLVLLIAFVVLCDKCRASPALLVQVGDDPVQADPSSSSSSAEITTSSTEAASTSSSGSTPTSESPETTTNSAYRIFGVNAISFVILSLLLQLILVK